MAQLGTKTNPAGVSATPSVGDRTPVPTSQAFSERHYSVGEIAAMWGVSTDVVRRLFQREPGVLVLGGQKTGKRRYATLRIPESVARRVHQKLSVVSV